MQNQRAQFRPTDSSFSNFYDSSVFFTHSFHVFLWSLRWSGFDASPFLGVIEANSFTQFAPDFGAYDLNLSFLSISFDLMLNFVSVFRVCILCSEISLLKIQNDPLGFSDFRSLEKPFNVRLKNQIWSELVSRCDRNSRKAGSVVFWLVIGPTNIKLFLFSFLAYVLTKSLQIECGRNV